MKIGHVESERTSSWPTLDQAVGWEERKGRKERGRKRESFRERDSTFSLNFPTIGPAVSGGARGRVHPHGKGFA